MLANSEKTEASHCMDAIIVGAGFAGLYMLIKLRQLGMRALVLEAGGGVGGTWYWNRYPGARCDNESVEYSYSFDPDLQREWRWKERYASQPEIQEYLEHVAQRYDLYPDIRFETKVTSARWVEQTAQWLVQAEGGQTFVTQFCVMATGNLSTPKVPDWPGVETFAGKIYHTGNWPREAVDFTGMRVGVVGTGSSGIQVIPQLAKQAASLTVFQRTPNFAVPAANRELRDEEFADVLEHYDSLREKAKSSLLGFFSQASDKSALEETREEQQRRYEECWSFGGPSILLSYRDLLLDDRANSTVAEFVRSKIREIVQDENSAESMIPEGYPLGARRLCIEIGYYDAINAENVTLVDVRKSRITNVTPSGVVTSDAHFELDALVLATGFYAMTGALDRIEIAGREGRSLRNEWAEGPRTYLGLMMSGFPNLFLVTGPGSPSVLSNVVVSIEQHVDWIAECISYMDDQKLGTIEPTESAEDEWLRHVDDVAQATLFPRANSWYMGRTRSGRQVFMPYVGGVGAYRQRCIEIVEAGYEGFTFSNQSETVERGVTCG